MSSDLKNNFFPTTLNCMLLQKPERVPIRSQQVGLVGNTAVRSTAERHDGEETASKKINLHSKGD